MSDTVPVESPERPERVQLRILVRHFFERFSDNELVPAGAEMHLSLVHILALLSVPGLLISFNMITTYARLLRLDPERAAAAALDDSCFFLYFSTVCAAFLTVFQWDALFPERRDYLILAPLPIPPRTILAAKVAALCLFLLVLTAASNAFSTVLFPLVSMQGSMVEVAGAIAAHAVAALAANAFVFFSLIAAQGVLLVLLPDRAFRRLARAAQFLLLVALLSVFFLMPRLSYLAVRESPAALAWFVPAWFLGLERFLTGAPEFAPLARRAVAALGLALAAFAATYGAAYRRRLRRSLEGDDEAPPAPRRVRIGLGALAGRLLLRSSYERAVFHFTARTLARSSRHRLYMATFAGVGLALVVMGLVTAVARGGPAVLRAPHTALLSIPLVLSFFLLAGMRFAFSVPADLSANWVFRLSRPDDRTRLHSAVYKAMAASGLVPLVALLAPLYAYLWGWAAAALHLAYVAALALGLVEVATFRWNKIPFTCSFLPGKANLKLFWFLYLFAFTTYAYTMAALEQSMLERPQRLARFFAVVFLLLGAAALLRTRTTRRSPPMFEERFGDPFESLEL